MVIIERISVPFLRERYHALAEKPNPTEADLINREMYHALLQDIDKKKKPRPVRKPRPKGY